jgi:RNA polymerase sigma factor (sigma-70 family)
LEPKVRFNRIYTEHYAKVFRLCKGYFNGDDSLAADASQEVFIKIWECLDGFRQEASLGTWVYRIAVNTCLLHLRKRSRSKETQTEAFPNLATTPYSPEKDQQVQRLYACINSLDDKSKMIILMVLEGLAYAEIAAVVGITEETLRVRIHRIKKTLTQCASDERI